MEWLLLLLAGGLLLALYWAYTHHGQPPAATPRNDGAGSSDVATRGLMQSATALTQAYARVLEQKDRGLIRPESSLPASKEVIKAALLLCALSTVGTARRRHDAATLRDFQVSYGFLAHFVADETFAKRMESATPLDPASGDLDPPIPGHRIADVPRDAGGIPPSPLEFLSLCQEFAQRFDALTDRERGRSESLRIKAALGGS